MPNNFIRLQVKSSGQYLSIQGSSNQNGALAVQGDTPTSNNFLWEIQDPGADGWSLIEVKSGLLRSQPDKRTTDDDDPI